MSINETYADDVEVTGGLLSLVQVIRNAGVLFQSETIMARHLALPEPPHYTERCKELFYKTYADQVKQVGLALDDATYTSIVRGQMPAEVMDTKYPDLRKTWVFNPKRREHWRKL